MARWMDSWLDHLMIEKLDECMEGMMFGCIVVRRSTSIDGLIDGYTVRWKDS